MIESIPKRRNIPGRSGEQPAAVRGLIVGCQPSRKRPSGVRRAARRDVENLGRPARRISSTLGSEPGEAMAHILMR